MRQALEKLGGYSDPRLQARAWYGIRFLLILTSLLLVSLWKNWRAGSQREGQKRVNKMRFISVGQLSLEGKGGEGNAHYHHHPHLWWRKESIVSLGSNRGAGDWKSIRCPSFSLSLLMPDLETQFHRFPTAHPGLSSLFISFSVPAITSWPIYSKLSQCRWFKSNTQ